MVEQQKKNKTKTKRKSSSQNNTNTNRTASSSVSTLASKKRKTTSMKTQEEQIGKGAFSSVLRPIKFLKTTTTNKTTSSKPYVIKRTNVGLPERTRKHIQHTYVRQKNILDYIIHKHPTKSGLFNQIYQITPNSQVKMKDLGDLNLKQAIQQFPLEILHDFDHIIKQLISAIVAIHHSGVVHRDIKPENVMAQYNPHTKQFTISFIDFVDALSKKEIERQNRFRFAGSPLYMSPELLRRNFSTSTKITTKGTFKEYVANDLWAFGMVLYQLIYNKNIIQMFSDMYFSKISYDNIDDVSFFYFNVVSGLPFIYDTLFPTEHLPSVKKQYVPLVRTLLSLNPQERLLWLRSQIILSLKQKQKS